MTYAHALCGARLVCVRYLSTSTWVRVGVRGPYAIRRMWDYFVTHLQGQTPPKQYEIKGAGELAVTH